MAITELISRGFMSSTSDRKPSAAQRFCALCLIVGQLLMLAEASAQVAPAKPRPNPADPAASVPALAYVSPLARYRWWADDPSVDWREANDRVQRIGGWRTYAREAQAPQTANEAPETREVRTPEMAASGARHAAPTK